ncbi:lipoprotein insertase outer membrane protein LolB [Aliiglaciecola sp. 3_MG-2023]|uniref:lipoprotein insertase outer membrane protein LolB n=1 Tax=Aliiglaciecola sp. 3_MG-2023 TaxID=3062644 RepID=UPI0026E44BF8|nr:lipoprotein insertase outer membrane protein LolB [Aliiglaciecola sp. 3_MG-2023]MDO6695566.1 lipoprotein insertase outer membrane protein LolB [Aliiglaciecola sp. 3_MG-2023]
MKPIYVVTACLLLLVLSGCVTSTKINQSINSERHQQQLSNLTNWKIKGRLAFKSEEEKVSAYMNWQQGTNQFDLQLNTFIGTNILKMQSDDNYTSLEVDDQTYTDTDANRLIFRVTGWNIPVEKLGLWVKGQHTEKDNVVYDEFGLVSQLEAKCRECVPWTLTFSDYQKVEGLWLPHLIQLTNTQNVANQIKIKISSWQKMQ